MTDLTNISTNCHYSGLLSIFERDKCWCEYWVILSYDNGLHFYQDKSSWSSGVKEVRFIQLTPDTVSQGIAQRRHNSSFHFKIHIGPIQYRFKCSSEELKQQWLSKLALVIGRFCRKACYHCYESSRSSGEQSTVKTVVEETACVASAAAEEGVIPTQRDIPDAELQFCNVPDDDTCHQDTQHGAISFVPPTSSFGSHSSNDCSSISSDNRPGCRTSLRIFDSDDDMGITTFSKKSSVSSPISSTFSPSFSSNTGLVLQDTDIPIDVQPITPNRLSKVFEAPLNYDVPSLSKRDPTRGFLKLLTSKKTWMRYCVVLEKNYLLLSDPDSSHSEIIRILLTPDLQFTLLPRRNHDYRFKMITNNCQYFLKSATALDRGKWIDEMSYAAKSVCQKTCPRCCKDAPNINDDREKESGSVNDEDDVFYVEMEQTSGNISRSQSSLSNEGVTTNDGCVVLHSGYLKTNAFKATWQQYWGVVKENTLVFCVSETDSKEIGEINLTTEVKCRAPKRNADHHKFMLVTSSASSYRFKCASIQDGEQWVKVLQALLEHLRRQSSSEVQSERDVSVVSSDQEMYEPMDVYQKEELPDDIGDLEMYEPMDNQKRQTQRRKCPDIGDVETYELMDNQKQEQPPQPPLPQPRPPQPQQRRKCPDIGDVETYELMDNQKQEQQPQSPLPRQRRKCPDIGDVETYELMDNQKQEQPPLPQPQPPQPQERRKCPDVGDVETYELMDNQKQELPQPPPLQQRRKCPDIGNVETYEVMDNQKQEQSIVNPVVKPMETNQKQCRTTTLPVLEMYEPMEIKQQRKEPMKVAESTEIKQSVAVDEQCKENPGSEMNEAEDLYEVIESTQSTWDFEKYIPQQKETGGIHAKEEHEEYNNPTVSREKKINPGSGEEHEEYNNPTVSREKKINPGSGEEHEEYINPTVSREKKISFHVARNRVSVKLMESRESTEKEVTLNEKTRLYSSLKINMQDAEEFITELLGDVELPANVAQKRQELSQRLRKLLKKPEKPLSSKLPHTQLQTTVVDGFVNVDQDLYEDNHDSDSLKSQEVVIYQKASDIKDRLHEGYLLKYKTKGLTMFNKWLRRYCILTSVALYYYADPKDLRQKGTIVLASSNYKLFRGCPSYPEVKENSVCFQLDNGTADQRFLFKVEKPEDYAVWCTKIEASFETKLSDEDLIRTKSVGVAEIEDDIEEDNYEPIDNYNRTQSSNNENENHNQPKPIEVEEEEFDEVEEDVPDIPERPARTDKQDVPPSPSLPPRPTGGNNVSTNKPTSLPKALPPKPTTTPNIPTNPNVPVKPTVRLKTKPGEIFEYSRVYVALYNCKADVDEDLGFSRGNHLYIREKIPNSDWWVATLMDSTEIQTGLVPINYIMPAYNL